MKNSACLLFFVVLFIGCKDDDEGIQILTNPDVETGDVLPNGWYLSSGQGKYAVIWTDDESYSPSKSLKISTPVSDPADFAFWGQSITENIPLGEDIVLRVKIKADLIGDGVAIAIRTDDTAPSDYQGEQFATTQGNTISGTFDWKEYSVKLEEVHKDTKTVTVYLIYLSNTSGEVYFDDIMLTY